tara:strand:- start:402 stop:725 length:324 start_codon:yes stop_codon:yes gene_type:complete
MVDDNIYLIFGYLASGTACIMMLPQVYLTVKKKRIEDLSIKTVSLGLLTQCLFFPYSIHFKLHPLFTVNIFLSFCDAFIICYYIYLKMNQKTTVIEETFLDDALLHA